MIYTIEDLANGRCVVKNDGTLEQLKEVIARAFPYDIIKPEGLSKYYGIMEGKKGYWFGYEHTSGLPFQSVHLFLQEPQENNKVTVHKFSDQNSASMTFIFGISGDLTGHNFEGCYEFLKEQLEIYLNNGQ